jgi:thiol-disulfide isomerase/thioredoxin
MLPLEPVETDEQGRFVYTGPLLNSKPTLLAMDSARRHMGVAQASARNETLKIVLRPVVRVEGTFDLDDDLSSAPSDVSLSVKVDAGALAFISSKTPTNLGFSIGLPRGSYLLVFDGPGIEKVEVAVRVPEHARSLDLGAIGLGPSVLAELIGKRAPAWHVTQARGVSDKVAITDFRGKWVLIEFWAHWCAPCVGGSLPRLMRIHEEHAQSRDRFQIIAFHDPSVKTLDELDGKLASVREKAWGAKDLPFPVLLDGTGRTIKRWGVRGYPTLVLIDPQGKVVRAESGFHETMGEDGPEATLLRELCRVRGD